MIRWASEPSSSVAASHRASCEKASAETGAGQGSAAASAPSRTRQTRSPRSADEAVATNSPDGENASAGPRSTVIVCAGGEMTLQPARRRSAIAALGAVEGRSLDEVATHLVYNKDPERAATPLDLFLLEDPRPDDRAVDDARLVVGVIAEELAVALLERGAPAHED